MGGSCCVDTLTIPGTRVLYSFKSAIDTRGPQNTMDAKTQEVLDALNAVGARLKEAKSSNGDVSAILAEYQTVKATLEALVRPKAEAAKDSDEALYEALMPAFEKVMTKGEKKRKSKAAAIRRSKKTLEKRLEEYGY